MLILALGLLGLAFEYVEHNTIRPGKSYWRTALGAIFLGLILLLMPLAMGAMMWIGWILWFALTGAALTWVIYYERTEPR